jgi:hypothetical protein
MCDGYIYLLLFVCLLIFSILKYSEPYPNGPNHNSYSSLFNSNYYSNSTLILILIHSHSYSSNSNSVLFCSILFCSLLVCAVLFYVYAVLFYSIRFGSVSIQLHSIIF